MTQIRQSRHFRAWIATAAILMAIVAIGYWFRWFSDRIAHRENALAALRIALEIVRQYVEVRGEWPKSWDDLESFSPPEPVATDYHWPQKSDFVRKYISIDFTVTVRDVAGRGPGGFTSIQMTGPRYGTYPEDFARLVMTCQEAADRSRSGRKPAERSGASEKGR
jgi:hypothetical protein